MRRRVTLGIGAFLAGAVFLVQGCGGGGSSTSQTAVKTTINWPARSKAVTALSSALSAKITLTSTTDNKDIDSFVVNRHDDPAAYADAVVSPNKINAPLGRALTKIAFFAAKDNGGGQVGETLATVTVKDDGSLLGSDGKEAEFTVSGKTATIAVTGVNVIALNDSSVLTFTAKAADGSTLALSDGSATFAVTEGGDTVLDVSADGTAHAKGIGTAKVTATADGKTSAPFNITVNYAVKTLEITPPAPVGIGDTVALVVTAKKADDSVIALPAEAITYKIVSGANNVTISADGKVTGAASGAAIITATADGKTSAPVTVTVNYGIASLQIAPGQTVAVGASSALSVTAKKADDSVITLPAGVITFITVPGGDGEATIGSDGKLSATGVGIVTVKALAEGKTSDATNVTVIPGATVTTAPSLQYQEYRLTNGTPVKTGNTVNVTYVGKLTDGTQFDAGNFSFKIGAGTVVAGFNEGVSTMKQGAKRHLIIPPNLGYGNNPPAGSSIPPGATLIFDVTVETVTP